MKDSKRKIIQIATGIVPSGKMDNEHEHYLYALCDDGTLWRWVEGVKSDFWAQHQEPIPQPDEIEE